MQKVNIPPVVAKLHWPHEKCEECDAKCEGSEEQGYTCVKCGRVYLGRTEYVQGIVHLIRKD